jgi:hypothetical protein
MLLCSESHLFFTKIVSEYLLLLLREMWTFVISYQGTSGGSLAWLAGDGQNITMSNRMGFVIQKFSVPAHQSRSENKNVFQLSRSFNQRLYSHKILRIFCSCQLCLTRSFKIFLN